MTDSVSVERITRLLAFMLRHQPEKFDLEVDPYGWAELDEVVRALNERLTDPVDVDEVAEAVEAGDRIRYEIKDERIRALYGHSIAVEPGDPCKPPQRLYAGLTSRDGTRARQYGLRGGRRRFLHLAVTPDDAMEAGRRAGREYVVVTVRALEAWEEGVNFYDRHSLFLAEEVPAHLLEVGPVHTDGYAPRWENEERDQERESGRSGRFGARGEREREGGRGRGRVRQPDRDRAERGRPRVENGGERADRERVRDKDRDTDRDRGPVRASDRGPARDRDRGPARDRDRDRGPVRDSDRGPARDSDRDADRGRVRDGDRDAERGRVRDGDRDAERGRVRDGDRDAERGRVRDGDRDAGRVRDGDRDAGRVRDGDRDAGRVRDGDRALGHEREREDGGGAGAHRRDEERREPRGRGRRGGRDRDRDRERPRAGDEQRRERPAQRDEGERRPARDPVGETAATSRAPRPAPRERSSEPLPDFGKGIFEQKPAAPPQRAARPAPEPPPARREPEREPKPERAPERRTDDGPGFGAGV